MFFPFFDPTFFILIPALLISMYAQYKVKSTFNKYLNVAASRGYTGAEVARDILQQKGIRNVTIERAQESLSDHYDPRSKTVRLSPEVYNGRSVASLGVAAHETGHAVQHAVEYLPLNIRHTLLPVANFGSKLGLPLGIFGFFFFRSEFMVHLGLIIFAGAVLFQIVTLPVEFNASARAIDFLRNGDYLARDEVKPAKKVLNAAALTYVAAVLVSIGHMLRLLMMASMLDDD
ncbi:zinc metallopeptidase [Sporohalobacter salinus]|uniref:zinc metallopeptidase n=1 Tax=Sporohalobacter salinus TaxID=1494606 RepID=UPI001960225E|nr:zinc metallopeptidase [Sporohalobacter salinus]MBM7623308.1 Zn-dependent membrane protease YugP [Sporohalobacter salinus]